MATVSLLTTAGSTPTRPAHVHGEDRCCYGDSQPPHDHPTPAAVSAAADSLAP